MLKIEFLEELFIIAIALSTITCTFIQKTKRYMPNSKCLPMYSFLVNLIAGVVFCITFTDITFPTSIWVGVFSFLGADTLYKALEEKLLSYTNIINKNQITISKENIINGENK